MNERSGEEGRGERTRRDVMDEGSGEKMVKRVENKVKKENKQEAK